MADNSSSNETPKRRRSSQSPKPPKGGMPIWLTTERMIIGAVVIGVLVFVAAIVINANQKNSVGDVSLDGVVAYPGLTQAHVDTAVTYDVIPPVGGPHNPVWQTCGVYNRPLINEHAVHSLEHGAIWITYQPDLPEDEVILLQSITVQTDHRLLSPYPGIDSPIILSAWGYQLKIDSADDPRLMEFINEYEQGPTTPERGATCARGFTGTAS